MLLFTNLFVKIALASLAIVCASYEICDIINSILLKEFICRFNRRITYIHVN